MNLAAVPVIDIAPFCSTKPDLEARKSEVAKEVKTACEKCGFFYVQNHGIPPALIRDVFRLSRIFFEELSAEQKNSVDARSSEAFRGYISQTTGLHTCNPKENEAFGSPRNQKDHKESFTIGADSCSEGGSFSSPMHGENNWPDETSCPQLEGFRSTLEAYWRAMLELSRAISQALARSLSLTADDFFLPYLTDPCAQMVLLRYPVADSNLLIETKKRKRSTNEKKIGCGAHTDCGFLTILATDTLPGLQVQHADRTSGKNRDGWIDVPVVGQGPEYPFVEGEGGPKDDFSFVVNLGDMAQRWSNERYQSTWHRVHLPVETESAADDASSSQNRPPARFSIPFFCNCNFDTPVDARDLLSAAAGVEEKATEARAAGAGGGDGDVQEAGAAAGAQARTMTALHEPTTAGTYIMEKLGLMRT